MDFKGKVVLITGASSGIGAATAVYLSSLGAKLSLTGRNVANLQKTAEECKKQKASDQIFTISADLAKEEDVEKIINETIKKYTRLDVLVNCAGFAKAGSLESCTLDEYDAMFRTNVRAVLQLTKLAMPYLVKTKGNVVNVSSVGSLRSTGTSLPYAMSKAALDHFTRCVALEVAPKQVRVNSVNPGAVPTQFHKTCKGVDDDSEIMRKLADYHPIGRVGKPEEIASAIAFLASGLASNITGAILSVDGGFAIALQAAPVSK